MKKQVISPLIGSIVTANHGGKNYPCDVYITSGNFSVDGRISNHWYWKRILPDGSLSDEECGYGSFEESTTNYKVEIKAFKIK